MIDFVAVDGEAIDDAYVLLAASTGQRVWHDEGLRSDACFDFLLDLAKPGRRLVCFGLNYDVNQWLSSVPLSILRALWRDGNACWRGYTLRWLPSRRFTVRDRAGRSATVCEVLGFFQCAFVAALEAWGIPAQDELHAMKARRGAFTASERGRVERYCSRECTDLVELMGRLHAATQTADCTPHEWIGAGALANAMLRSRGVSEHHRHDDDLTDENGKEAIMRAYFGGRVEALALGSYHSIAAMDVRSAYPWAATSLPSLADASLAWRRRYDPGAEHAIWRVRWRGARGALMPFPVRDRRRIFYPRAGEGFYHGAEVRAALAAGFEADVLGGYVLRAPSGEAPFAWVPEAFELRARWKREGNAAEKALKLGLNSLYGKLAQGVGYQRGGPPRWQSYFWAGEITARTRARMLGAALHARDPLAIATDGLFARGSNGHRAGEALGAWELSRWETLFIAQAGLYAGEQGGELVLRSRGHFARELDYAALREGFEREGYTYVHFYDSRRFVGLGSALMLRDMRKWRKWPTERRSVALYPMRKIAGEGGVLHPPDGRGLAASEPYEPKGALLDTGDLDNVQAMEQPMRSSL